MIVWLWIYFHCSNVKSKENVNAKYICDSDCGYIIDAYYKGKWTVCRSKKNMSLTLFPRYCVNKWNAQWEKERMQDMTYI